MGRLDQDAWGMRAWAAGNAVRSRRPGSLKKGECTVEDGLFLALQERGRELLASRFDVGRDAKDNANDDLSALSAAITTVWLALPSAVEQNMNLQKCVLEVAYALGYKAGQEHQERATKLSALFSEE